MSDNSKNTNRIAKNTIALYVRMMLLMGINFFSTRIILQALGVDDYGIYNVIGGFVSLFSIVSQALSSACSRFLTYEIGKGNNNKLKMVFSTCVSIHLLLAFVVAILAEFVGLWFIYNKMIIPEARLFAANWIFQFSVVSLCINLISVPYNAAIIAHERMTAFAYIGLYEGVSKLLICYLVFLSPIDKLIIYAGLICLVQLSVRFLYSIYCKRNFNECIYSFTYDKTLVHEIFNFSGWNFIGAISVILRNQGSNVLINLFFGTVVNAAIGIANQVNRAISMFSGSFVTAVKPQITKSYAVGNIEYASCLVKNSARFSFFLLLIIAIPIGVNINYILSIWLTEIPSKTPLFIILVIALALIEILSDPLITLQLATGKIRNYQLVVGGINLLNIPLSYILLKNGCPSESFLYVMIVLSGICLFARLFMLKINVSFDVKGFVNDVVLKCLFTTILSLIIPLFLYDLLSMNNLNFIVCVSVSFLWTIIIVYYCGCEIDDKEFLKNAINKFFVKLKMKKNDEKK